MTAQPFRHAFVDTVPSDLEAGVLYVSIPLATALHLCACGCGHEVVTPIAPEWWRLTFDGETVTLTPSIGNARMGCASHYWIHGDIVRWAPDSGFVHPSPDEERLTPGTESGGLLLRAWLTLKRLMRRR